MIFKSQCVQQCIFMVLGMPTNISFHQFLTLSKFMQSCHREIQVYLFFEKYRLFCQKLQSFLTLLHKFNVNISKSFAVIRYSKCLFNFETPCIFNIDFDFLLKTEKKNKFDSNLVKYICSSSITLFYKHLIPKII